jgi:hypothetical protein
MRAGQMLSANRIHNRLRELAKAAGQSLRAVIVNLEAQKSMSLVLRC